MWPLLDDPALRLADETVSYGELLLAGADSGLFDSAVATTTRATRLLQSGLVDPAIEELKAEAVGFRQHRRLQSGEDLRAWLASRELETLDWQRHLRRAVAARSPADPPDVSFDEGAFAPALVADLACSGWWRTVADEVERCWAASCLSGVTQSDIGADLLTRAEELAARVRAIGTLDVAWCTTRLQVLRSRQSAPADAEQRFSSDGAVSGRLADHATDWMRLVYDELCLPTRAAANETVMCFREDGLSAGEIARRSGRELEHYDLRRDQVPPATAVLLGAGMPGELLGPLQASDGFHVLWLEARRPPSLDDPDARRAASAELLAEALARAAAGRARSVGPL